MSSCDRTGIEYHSRSNCTVIFLFYYLPNALAALNRLQNLFVCQWVNNRVERSTDLNPPPIFTKLAIKVEFRENWLPIGFGGDPTDACPPNRKWN